METGAEPIKLKTELGGYCTFKCSLRDELTDARSDFEASQAAMAEVLEQLRVEGEKLAEAKKERDEMLTILQGFQSFMAPGARLLEKLLGKDAGATLREEE